MQPPSPTREGGFVCTPGNIGTDFVPAVRKTAVMKKFLLTLVALAGTLTALHAAKPVEREELPYEAQRTLRHYFGNAELQQACRSRDGYEVRFRNGTEVAFNREGEWREIDCAPRTVPETLVPAKIRRLVNDRFAGRKIVRIERHFRGYEVELDNDTELLFSRSARLVGLETGD